MEIQIFNEYQKEISFDYQKIINDFLSFKGFESDKIISLILVDNNKIHEINKNYRNKDYVTDVISFESDDEENDLYAGEIFLSIDRAFEQAKMYQHSIEREFAFLLCHGILHLHGYDHMNKVDEEIMFAKQEEILNKLKYVR